MVEVNGSRVDFAVDFVIDFETGFELDFGVELEANVGFGAEVVVSTSGTTMAGWGVAGSRTALVDTVVDVVEFCIGIPAAATVAMNEKPSSSIIKRRPWTARDREQWQRANDLPPYLWRAPSPVIVAFASPTEITPSSPIHDTSMSE